MKVNIYSWAAVTTLLVLVGAWKQLSEIASIRNVYQLNEVQKQADNRTDDEALDVSAANETFANTTNTLAPMLASSPVSLAPTVQQVPSTEVAKLDDIYSDNEHVAKLMRASIEDLPEPLQVLREYISLHGVHVQGSTGQLRNDTKYMLVAYHCPSRAGNCFSNALNAMVLAILSNRTLLWRYMPEYDPYDACSNIVHRSAWMAPATRGFGGQKYKFRQRVQIEQACQRVFNTTDHGTCTRRLGQAPNGTAKQLAQDIHHHQVMEMRGVTGCFQSHIPGWAGRFDMRVPTCGDYVRATFQSVLDQDRIHQLYKYGLDFLYGMVFRHAFALTLEFVQSIQYTHAVDPAAFSVAVHSRHPQASTDGSDVSAQTKCLDQILVSHQRSKNHTGSPSLSCQILILSDREATNHGLLLYAQQRGCQGITVQHTAVQQNLLSKEHGPFEGAGFWKDLVLFVQARHGLVTTTRSSSGLLQNLVVYDRTMERHQSSQRQELTVNERHEPITHGLHICHHNHG